MNEPFARREERSAPSGTPLTPFQTPAIDRDPTGPKGSGEGVDGVEANFGLGDIWNIAKKVLF
ncbi:MULTISPECIES: hypothetical protein [unclassified Streptomyces]|uniref:hypothetical protein n=1 Tax=unclassified Streptomyces TaxID=2593676 RepID=UPI002E0F0095|nr:MULTISPECIES: hypothetical protein [unclassified Streptomyces]WSR23991.1 hypothetical protein OG573_36320 [Streptomyces sp. NBC_01205]